MLRRLTVRAAAGLMTSGRRLNTIFERSTEHLVAFVVIAFISILCTARNPKKVE